MQRGLLVEFSCNSPICYLIAHWRALLVVRSFVLEWRVVATILDVYELYSIVVRVSFRYLGARYLCTIYGIIFPRRYILIILPGINISIIIYLKTFFSLPLLNKNYLSFLLYRIWSIMNIILLCYVWVL